MATLELKVSVRLAWWLRPYLHALAFFCALHRCRPDPVKLHRTIMRAVSVTVGHR